jgi:hypothetical protein
MHSYMQHTVIKIDSTQTNILIWNEKFIVE